MDLERLKRARFNGLFVALVDLDSATELEVTIQTPLRMKNLIDLLTLVIIIKSASQTMR